MIGQSRARGGQVSAGRRSALFAGARLAVLALAWTASNLTVATAAEEQAARPNAAALLPDDTAVLVRAPDTRVLVERFRQTSIGRIGSDEQVSPLIRQLYGSAAEAFAEIEDEVGLSLEDLLSLPQGEVALAVTAPMTGPPAVAVLFEAGARVDDVAELLRRGIDQAAGNLAVGAEKIGDTTLHTYRSGFGERLIVGYFVRDGVLVVVNRTELAEFILAAWDGAPTGATLAESRQYTSVMSRCQPQEDDEPQFLWYVDPLAMTRAAVRGTPGQFVLAFIPATGLDGLKAAGGSIALATDDFDSVQHFHLLLDTPRSGVLDAIALGSGDTTPEPWVARDAASYLTIYWNFQQTFDASSRVYDSLTSEGALARELQTRVGEPLGIDVLGEILPALDGRVTVVSRIEPPARLNGQANLIGVKLKDVVAFRPILERIVERQGDRFERKGFGGVVYYRADNPLPAPGPAGEDAQRLPRREPEIVVGLVDDYLLIGDSAKTFEHAIITKSQPGESLAAELDFKLVHSKLRRQVGSAKPGMISFTRPEEQLRLVYDLAAAQSTREFLSGRSENSRFFRAFHEALRDNPLPPFAVVSQHLAPGGSVLMDDETGLHYLNFTLRRGE